MPFMERSANIAGPYLEHRQLIHKADHEPNQGGLVQTEKGDWYFLTHHGVSQWDGRELSLLPVTWDKDWPVWGTSGKDGIGSMVWTAKKPGTDLTAEPIQASDDFGGKTLAPQWEWYYQPNNDKWSLTERPGYLRLYSSKALEPRVVTKIPNIITQRTLRLQHSIASVKFDMAHMTDGQIAAFCLLGKSPVTIGVIQSGNTRRLYFNAAGKTTDGQEIEIANVWFRATWDANGLAHFLYSTDGVNYDNFGEPFTITNFDNNLGARLAIYTVDENAGTGFLDVDWFHYNVEN